uniref:Uncharacterized protein n=1 Tax=Entomoneis paludosa TaxID=265537 RepID=A0A7S2Y934_9STRA|mmetsp:Transcript_23231/g.48306  ORF Transcript_23231/g.48306 Transcript_23231/m.48306 type:complete len:179 (+) Transcript_23231:327-863(+)|eukprot:CAMPEP_0172461928 /NCGR_PEP_ID=MMETSP1065-20121228/42190_1 /TAXON_ID=265537 /ORGANISM="Amphiprora paludosa, Strain CCMP125" /LENGTH=178 /DNA_ID=CAMNT_0013217427 /DNA_START=298 /DNA_END=834 /DNA_ORIENTATION=+
MATNLEGIGDDSVGAMASNWIVIPKVDLSEFRIGSLAVRLQDLNFLAKNNDIDYSGLIYLALSWIYSPVLNSPLMTIQRIIVFSALHFPKQFGPNSLELSLPQTTATRIPCHCRLQNRGAVEFGLDAWQALVNGLVMVPDKDIAVCDMTVESCQTIVTATKTGPDAVFEELKIGHTPF